MIIIHILAALLSLLFTTFTFLRPSVTRLRTAYGLVAITVGTGVYLVVSAPTHMIEACIMGLFYLGLVTIGIAAARYKLALVTKKS